MRACVCVCVGACIPYQPVKAELGVLPTIVEPTKAIEPLKSCKAAGVERIPHEIWKHEGPCVAYKTPQRSYSKTAWKNPLSRPWCLATHHYVVSNFKNTCRAAFKDKRPRRKNRNAMPSSPGQTFSCGCCNCTCLSCIGLISHWRNCSRCKTGPFLIFVSRSWAMMIFMEG